jgi:hypothetical protein
MKAKRDANEASVFAILRAHGLSVYPLDLPLDALVGYAGQNYLVEVKDGPKAAMRPKQVEFFKDWPGQFAVIRTDGEAEAFAVAVRAENAMKIRGSAQ